MFTKFKRKKKLLGLDIGTSSVKIVELSYSNSRYCLENYAVAPFPEDAVLEKEIRDIEGVTEAIKTAFAHGRFSTNHTALAMPSSLVITKIIQMDASLSEIDLEPQIELDANRYIPYPLEEVSLDFTVLGLNAKDNTKNDILLAASRKEQVDARVDAVQDASLIVDVVDVESYALERSLKLLAPQLPDGGEDRLIAMVNIGGSVSSLSVFENLQLVYTREEAFGGRQLTESIRNHYDMDYEQAERAKSSGTLPPEYETDVLQPFKETIAMQVFNALQFYYSSTDEENIDHLLLAGGVASIPGVIDLIRDRTGIETSLANPFSNMDVGKRINQEILTSDASSLLVCCGLAMRSFEA
ncbi:MAG: pilus assembly protein PilM [Legionellales bacterium]|nr:pilus assembly protein PilM [Legionellales bacterium]